MTLVCSARLSTSSPSAGGTLIKPCQGLDISSKKKGRDTGREDVGGLQDDDIDYRSKEITSTHRCVLCDWAFVFLCLLLWCTALRAQMCSVASWCNVERTRVVCQMRFCSAKSGLTGTPSEACRQARKGLWADPIHTWRKHLKNPLPTLRAIM